MNLAANSHTHPDASAIKTCVSIVFVPLNPPFRDQFFLLPGISLPTVPQVSQKKREGHSAECKKKNENTKVLKKHKRIICVFKCWLNYQLASLEAVLSLGKINAPCHFQCLSANIENDFRQHRLISYVSRITSCRVKELSWRRNGPFFRTEKKPRRTSLPRPSHPSRDRTPSAMF